MGNTPMPLTNRLACRRGDTSTWMAIPDAIRMIFNVTHGSTHEPTQSTANTLMILGKLLSSRRYVKATRRLLSAMEVDRIATVCLAPADADMLCVHPVVHSAGDPEQRAGRNVGSQAVATLSPVILAIQWVSSSVRVCLRRVVSL